MIDKIKEALAHNEEEHRILEGILGQLEEEKENKKVTLQIKVKPVFAENLNLDDNEVEQLKKDLEEIMNDFTRK